MTPLPKRRLSRRRQGKRRAAIKLVSLNLANCPSCQAKKRPHTACPKCGEYKNIKVTPPMAGQKPKVES